MALLRSMRRGSIAPDGRCFKALLQVLACPWLSGLAEPSPQKHLDSRDPDISTVSL
jgi:hypothetical protein